MANEETGFFGSKGLGIPLIGSGLGLIGGLFGAAAERRKQEAEGKMRAAEIEASPWTKMGPETKIEFASPTAGKAIGGLGAGLGLAQNVQNSMQTNPWANMQSKDQAVALVGQPTFYNNKLPTDQAAALEKIYS